MLYNTENLLEELNLTKKEEEELIQDTRDEFPQDEMFFELHLYSAVQIFKEAGKNYIKICRNVR